MEFPSVGQFRQMFVQQVHTEASKSTTVKNIGNKITDIR